MSTEIEARISNLDSERRMHYALMFMGISGGILFIALIGLILYFSPMIKSLLLTGQLASSNIVTASGVIANASADQVHQMDHIETDIRTTVVKLNRTVIPAASALINTSNQQITQSGKMIIAATKGIGDIDTHVSTLVDALKKTSDQATTDLTTINNSVQIITPKLQQSIIDADTSANNFNALLESKDTLSALNGLSNTTQNLGKITGDGYVFLHPYLNPDPCKTKRCSFKRSVWPYIKGSLLVGSEARTIDEWFNPIPVIIRH